MRPTLKFLLLLLSVLLLFFITWGHLPAEDYQRYFDFVDKGSFLGIPNFLNVFSNLPFVFVGIWMLIRSANFKKGATLESSLPSRSGSSSGFSFLQPLGFWVILVAFGSAYFHWLPNSQTVFWDRIPIAFSLFCIISMIVKDRVGEFQAKFFFVLSNALVAAVFYLQSIGMVDLRPYLGLQYGGILFIVLLALLTKSREVSNALIFKTVGLYALAKVFEVFDGQVESILYIVGGHPIKHLVAAYALFYFAKGLAELDQGHIKAA